MAALITYAVAGTQYIAVQLEYGGTGIAEGTIPPSSAAIPKPAVRAEEAFEKPPEQKASKAEIDVGEALFVQECSRCHALGLNLTPDLRRLDVDLHAQFKEIVLHGLLAPSGMERFDDILTEQDVERIHAHLSDQTWVAYRAQQAAKQ